MRAGEVTPDFQLLIGERRTTGHDEGRLQAAQSEQIRSGVIHFGLVKGLHHNAPETQTFRGGKLQPTLGHEQPVW